MVELVYRIDNWSIIKIIGGLGVLLTGSVTLVATAILDRYRVKWRHDASQNLEEIKVELAQNSSTLLNIQSNFLHYQQTNHAKKLEAIEAVWLATLEIKKGIPPPVAFTLQFLDDSEVKNSTIDSRNKKGESIGQMMSKLDPSLDTIFIIEPSEAVHRLRPFITAELFSLFKTYVGIIGRVTHMSIINYKKGTLTTWKHDTAVESLLRSSLSEDEFAYIMEDKVGSLNHMSNLLELKMLDNIREGISGKDVNSENIQELKRLEKIFALEN